MTTLSIDNMPEVVHEPYAFLLDKTGVEPIVERNGYGKILLTHLGERTKMTIKFRLDGRKWRWEKSHLFIDGKAKPLASGWDMYVSIYKDPDNGRKDFVPKGARKAKLPEMRTVENEEHLPSAVADCLRGMRSVNTKTATTVVKASISLDGKQYLLSVVDTDKDGDESTIILTFGFGGSPSGAMEWTITGGLAVNRRGYDVTNYLNCDLNTALMDLLGAQSRAAQVPFVPGGSAQQAATTNSVNVRKSTVFRI